MESIFAFYLIYCSYDYADVESFKRGAANCANANPHIQWPSGLCCLTLTWETCLAFLSVVIFGHIKRRDCSRGEGGGRVLFTQLSLISRVFEFPALPGIIRLVQQRGCWTAAVVRDMFAAAETC